MCGWLHCACIPYYFVKEMQVCNWEVTFCMSWVWLDSLEAKLKHLSYTKLVINLAMPKSLTLIMELCLFHQSVHSLVLGVADIWNPTAATLLPPDGPHQEVCLMPFHPAVWDSFNITMVKFSNLGILSLFFIVLWSVNLNFILKIYFPHLCKTARII